MKVQYKGRSHRSSSPFAVTLDEDKEGGDYSSNTYPTFEGSSDEEIEVVEAVDGSIARNGSNDETETTGFSSQDSIHQHKETPAAFSSTKSFRRGRPHCSRLLSLVLGMMALVGVILIVVHFLDKNDISLKKNAVRHPDFQGTVTAAELVDHNIAEDCWLMIHDNVYDLTDYALEHPGGEEFITDFCGMDATRDYDIEHPTSLLKTIRHTLLGTYIEDSTTTEDEAPPEEEKSSPEDVREDEVPVPEEEEIEPEPEQPEDREETSPTTSPTPGPTERGCRHRFFTTEEVEEHSDRDDCYYILYGRVYDMTDYAEEHPGGTTRILRECGTDATAGELTKFSCLLAAWPQLDNSTCSMFCTSTLFAFGSLRVRGRSSL